MAGEREVRRLVGEVDGRDQSLRNVQRQYDEISSSF